MKVIDLVNLFMEELRVGHKFTPECTIDQLQEAKKLSTKCSRCAKQLSILPGLFNLEGWRIIHPHSNDGMSYVICRACMDQYQEKIEEIRRLKLASQTSTPAEEELEGIELDLTKVSLLKKEYIEKQLYYEAMAMRRHQNILFSQIEQLRGSEYLREKWKVERGEDDRFKDVGDAEG